MKGCARLRDDTKTSLHLHHSQSFYDCQRKTEALDSGHDHLGFEFGVLSIGSTIFVDL